MVEALPIAAPLLLVFFTFAAAIGVVSFSVAFVHYSTYTLLVGLVVAAVSRQFVNPIPP